MLWWVLTACPREEPEQGETAAVYVTEPCEACDGECADTTGDPGGGQHVEGDLDYSESPPLGGNHNGCWAAWGVHEETVAPENWIHNLEHGGVVVLVSCPGEGCVDDRLALAEWVLTLPEGRALLTDYAGAPMPYTLVSWGHRLELGCVDLVEMQAFFDANEGQAPEDVIAEPKASCL